MNKSNIKYKFRLPFNTFEVVRLIIYEVLVTINIFELRTFGKAVP